MSNCDERSVTGLLMLLFIGAVTLANVLTTDKPFSESENRVLELRPEFTFHSLMSGRFISDYEQYTSDQFALRDDWVGVKTGADRALGKKDNNGVYLGRDGYLLEHYTSPSDIVLRERVQALQRFHDATPELHKYVMISPTAPALLSDKLPAFAPVGKQREDLDLLRRMLPPSMSNIDVYSVLNAQRGQPLYYKTDHHWTTYGAYHAYRALCIQMGIIPLDVEDFVIWNAADDFYGSLSSKSGYRLLQPDRLELYLPREKSKLEVSYLDEERSTSSLYEEDHLCKKDKYAVFLNGNHALIRIKTEGPADKRLLVIKDSYANSLVPFLTSHFGEIDIVDLRYSNEQLIQLLQVRQYENMLLLYNAKTFFEDPSIMNISEGIG